MSRVIWGQLKLQTARQVSGGEADLRTTQWVCTGPRSAESIATQDIVVAKLKASTPMMLRWGLTPLCLQNPPPNKRNPYAMLILILKQFQNHLCSRDISFSITFYLKQKLEDKLHLHSHRKAKRQAWHTGKGQVMEIASYTSFENTVRFWHYNLYIQ